MRQAAGRIALSTVLLFVVSCVGWLVLQEYFAFGSIQWNAGRRLFTQSDITGKVNGLFYEVSHAGAPPQEIAIGKAFVTICIVFVAILLFRLFWMVIISMPRYSTRVRKILEPLNELALKADELSRLEFGEDKAGEYVAKALEADAKNVDAICANARYLVASTGSYYQAASYLGSQLEQFDESSEEYNTIYTQFYNYYIYYAIYGM